MRLTLVSALAYVTTHFDLPSSPHIVADFLSEVRFYTENGRFAFLCPRPLGGLGSTYDVHVRFMLGSLENA